MSEKAINGVRRLCKTGIAQMAYDAVEIADRKPKFPTVMLVAREMAWKTQPVPNPKWGIDIEDLPHGAGDRSNQQLAEMTGVPLTQVRRAVRVLSEMGLFADFRRGNQNRASIRVPGPLLIEAMQNLDNEEALGPHVGAEREGRSAHKTTRSAHKNDRSAPTVGHFVKPLVKDSPIKGGGVSSLVGKKMNFDWVTFKVPRLREEFSEEVIEQAAQSWFEDHPDRVIDLPSDALAWMRKRCTSIVERQKLDEWSAYMSDDDPRTGSIVAQIHAGLSPAEAHKACVHYERPISEWSVDAYGEAFACDGEGKTWRVDDDGDRYSTTSPHSIPVSTHEENHKGAIAS